jgi:hypothetical protein
MNRPLSIGPTRILAVSLLSSATAILSSRLDKLLFLLLASGSMLLALCIATSLWDAAERRIAAAIRKHVFEPLAPLVRRELARAKFAARTLARLAVPVAPSAAPNAPAGAAAKE